MCFVPLEFATPDVVELAVIVASWLCVLEELPPERWIVMSKNTSCQAPPASVPTVTVEPLSGALNAPSLVVVTPPLVQFQVATTPAALLVPVLQTRAPVGKTFGPVLWLFESSPTTLQVMYVTVSGPAVAWEDEAVMPNTTAPTTSVSSPTSARRRPP